MKTSAARCGPGFHMRFRQRDDRAGPGGIVDRAVADIVALVVRRAAAEMVPVGRVDHIFVRPFGPGQNADHVLRRIAAHRIVEGGRDCEAQRHGFEALLHRRAFHQRQVLARRRHQLLGDIVLDPAIDQRLVSPAIGALGKACGPVQPPSTTFQP